jgi:hypothetical protein
MFLFCVFVSSSCVSSDASDLGTAPFFRPAPGYSTVCRATITRECASAAAADIGYDVAWIPPPRFAKLNGLESNHSTAMESLIVSEGALGVESNTGVRATHFHIPKGIPVAHSIKRIKVGSTKLTLLSVTAGSFRDLRLTWHHRGRRYSIGLGAEHPLDESTLLNYWRAVVYAT